MIRHIVFFSARDPADIEAMHAGLNQLDALRDLGLCRHFEVQKNRKIDTIDNRVDLVVYAEFDDEAQLARYQAHPVYRDCIDVVRPLRDLRVAADCEGRSPG